MSDRTEAPPRERLRFINEGVPKGGLRGSAGDALSSAHCRISPQPFPLRPETIARLEQMGGDLLAFYRAANRLYLDAARGNAPAWVEDYLDRGKGDQVRDLGRLRRTRTHLPRIIRPDLMALEDGSLRATELDAVPGGFGALAAFSQRYAGLGFNVVGGGDGIVRGMAAMLRDAAGNDDPNVAIVVSEESADYRPEMEWIAAALRDHGLNVHRVDPRELALDGESMLFPGAGEHHRADVVYRFFELHDLRNIPKMELLFYALKHRLVIVTPPIKTYLEEKLLFALFRHPALEHFWRAQLAEDVVARLESTLPETWVLDSRPLPPHAAICPPMEAGGRRILRWDDLQDLTQRERRLVAKPSGYSELAWGARGVTIGHDVSGDVWATTVRRALDSFDGSPYVLQHFYQSRRVNVHYFDVEADAVRDLDGRARISPFYFVVGDRADLAGVLVTVVPSPNKIIHGTPEAVMAPAMPSADALI